MRALPLIALLWSAVLAHGATNIVVFRLNKFTGQPSTNRTVRIVPLSANILDDAEDYHSDMSGEFSVTNMAPGLYQVNVQAPPQLSTRYLAVPETNGTFIADALLSNRTNAAWPPPGYAWSIAASDARYALIGSGGVALPTGIVTNNQQVVSFKTINVPSDFGKGLAFTSEGGSTNLIVYYSDDNGIWVPNISGNGQYLKNLNGAELQTGSVSSEALDAQTQAQLALAGTGGSTNVVRLVEPDYVAGTNSWEAVYSHTASTNLFIYGITNHAADGFYWLRTNWQDGLEYSALWTNASRDVIWRWNDDVDTVYRFTNSTGHTNFSEYSSEPEFGGNDVVLTGGLCGHARFSWTTNFTFNGFGVNGESASDGAVLAWGPGLDYWTNGGIWTIYATNIPASSLGTTNAPAAGRVLSVDESSHLYWGEVSGAPEVLNTNAIMVSEKRAAFHTNYTDVHGTNSLGLVLTNGYAGYSGTMLAGAYSVICRPVGGTEADWSPGETNGVVEIALAIEIAGGGTPAGFTNLTIYTWTRPDLWHHTNSMRGQYVFVDPPKYADQVAPREWVIQTANRAVERGTNWAAKAAASEVDLAGNTVRVSADWGQSVLETLSSDSLSVRAFGSNVWTLAVAPTVSAPANYSVVIYDSAIPLTSSVPYQVGVDVPKPASTVYAPSNVLVCLPASWTSSVPRILWSHKTQPYKWLDLPLVTSWPATKSFVTTQTNWNFDAGFGDVWPAPGAIMGYTFQTNTGILVSFQMPSLDQGYFKVCTNTFAPALGLLSGVLGLPPRTITNSTSTTWGRGAGLICCDTNYVYISVGTNLWKRVGVGSW